MATIPAHIKTARKKGALAGLEQLHDYLARNTNEGTNGLPAAQEMLAEIRKVGGYRKRDGVLTKQDKAVAWYCNHFDGKFHTGDLPATKGTTTRTTRRTAQATQAQEAEAPQVDPGLLAQIAQALGLSTAQASDTDVEDEDDEDTEVIQGVQTRRVNRTRNTEVTDEQGNTAVYPPPRDPDAPATQGKLWKLNHDGPAKGLFMCVIDADGNILAGGDEPLTAGECYELISENLAS